MRGMVIQTPNSIKHKSLRLPSMEASSLLSCSSKTHFTFNLQRSSPPSSLYKHLVSFKPTTSCHRVSCTTRTRSSLAIQQALDKSRDSVTVATNTSNEMIPKIDKSGRFCSPRAGRELALLIVYASCLEGSDPIRLFEKQVNSRREPGYEFDKASLLEYNHMSFGGPPVKTETVEEAHELLRNDEMESAIEAEILSAPPKLVYSKQILRFTRKLLVAVVERWDSHVRVIDKVVPPNWKDQPSRRILELSILHLAMSEITVLGTPHQIVINEAVDLAKRFCDGASPRIINGCLRTFVKAKASEEVSVEV